MPAVVKNPDCHPAKRDSSLTKNQIIIWMRGFFRAIEYACARYLACVFQATPKVRSGGLVW